jgi:hypothetical protein
MAFYMKKELFYFTIEEPNKEIYACKYKETAQRWLLNIKQAVRFAQELEKTPHLISEIKKNELVIEDKPQEIEAVVKKVKKNIFNLALGNRNSRSSVKSDNSLRERDPPVKTESTHPHPQHPVSTQSPSVDHTSTSGNNSTASNEPRTLP